MIKFSYQDDHNSGRTISYTTNEEALDNILEDFTLFLKSVGFYLDNGRTIQVVKEEEELVYDNE